jgi:phosphatidylglycerophosphate synthase
VVRFILVPIVFWLLYAHNYGIGVPLFLFAGLTDILDGSLARVRGQVTEWGIVYDPIADKLLVCAVLAVMVFEETTDGIAAALLGIELLLLAGNVVLKRRGIIRAANGAGKAKMALEVIGLALLLSAFATQSARLAEWATGTLVVAGVAAVASVVMGYVGMRREMRAARSAAVPGYTNESA